MYDSLHEIYVTFPNTENKILFLHRRVPTQHADPIRKVLSYTNKKVSANKQFRLLSRLFEMLFSLILYSSSNTSHAYALNNLYYE
jgi:hypothetical protein